MKAFRPAVIPALIPLLFLTACSDSPQPSAEKKAKPAEPVTGLTAMYQMYNMGRQWAPDLQVLRVRSIRLAEVESTGGKSGAWEATFVSPSRSAARTYTYSVVEAPGNLHQGVFGGLEEGYSGPRGQERPFPINVVRTDTDKTYEIALKKGDYYAKEHPKMPISFLLELTPRHTDPVWRVVWGESVATSGFSILIDSATGEHVQTLR
jgi:hypothetical protein